MTLCALSAALAACGSNADVGDGTGNPDGSGDGGSSGTGGDGTQVIDPGTGFGSNRGCEPTTCEEQDKQCGTIADGCGDVIDCGGCDEGSQCGIVETNQCTKLSDLCQPLSEEAACANKECGIAGDGCGGTYTCGTCAEGEACGIEAAFQCDADTDPTDNECPARIESCASVGVQCGIIGNGCGGTIDCDAEPGGGCPTDNYCGLGGPGICGSTGSTCTPLEPSVACEGKCGIVSNGCGAEVDGGVINCSTLNPCPTGTACGASGVPNVCGNAENQCAPLDRAVACAGRSCGVVSDGCEGQYTCGSGCDSDEQCQAGSCVALCTPVEESTACAGKECGRVGDGCGGIYQCGTCGDGESCGLEEAFQCASTPPASCVALTATQACAGKECGVVYDGCGTAASNQIQCGSNAGGCGTGEYCGLKAPYQCDAPTAPTCEAADSCADLGWSCGVAVDDCGNTFDCAAEGRECSSLQTCMGGIDGPTECVSGGQSGDCPLCSAVPDCSGAPQLTTLKGRVITPGRENSNTANQVGVPNAFVYILRSNDPDDLPPFDEGIPTNGESCERCQDQPLGAVLASAVTDAHGEYTIEGNVPVGQEFLLVVKVGKFRRAQHVTVPAAQACGTTNLPTSLPNNPTRLPRSMSDGLAVNIPHVAVATGDADGMECVFWKMGIANSEFTAPQGSGRVHLYRGNGAWPSEAVRDCVECEACGGGGGDARTCRATYCSHGTGSCSDSNSTQCRTAKLAQCAAANLPTDMDDFDDERLHEDGGALYDYDMVVYDCEGTGWDHHNDVDDNVRGYVNRGGRLFASHYSRHWLCDNGDASYSANDPYNTGLEDAGTFDCNGNGSYPSSGTGIVSLSRPGANVAKLTKFAAWLDHEGAADLVGNEYRFSIQAPRDLATAVGAYAEEFVFRRPGSNSTSVQQFSFTTPYGAPSDAACGRVAYSAFHVLGGSGSGSGSSEDVTFPDHCTGNLTAQEKVLLYSLFDLGGCVGEEPEPPECTPQACTGNTCGPQADGCGGTQVCGCASGEICNGAVCEVPGCTKTSCSEEGATCGIIADGCGSTIDCGECPSCEPIPEATACEGRCGFASDGCGSVYECGLTCPDGQTCADGACVGGNCNPAACRAELECGYVSDGCEGVAYCGDCSAPEVCGAGGVANMCGTPVCDPLTCADVGANCGIIGDGCGGVVNCGGCDPGQACGGNGAPNQCVGCVARTCEDAGAECGAIGDGCGGVVECGPCGAGELCGAVTANQCDPGSSCEPLDCAAVDAECGIIGDGCGGVDDCGACTGDEICGVETAFKCGPPPACTKLTCQDVGAQCGKIGDGCGGEVDCGSCPDGASCGLNQANKCSTIK